MWLLPEVDVVLTSHALLDCGYARILWIHWEFNSSVVLRCVALAFMDLKDSCLIDAAICMPC